jgi:3-oxoacyl-[acyl-carrier protein] reductase
VKDEVKGKVFLVTGSGCGLGAALATAAARAGGRVVINCRRDEKRAEALAAELRKTCPEVRAVKADVTEAEGARRLVEEAHKAFGRVDVLVNTVGAFEWKTVADMDPAEWRLVLGSNLDSVYNVSRLVLPGMRAHRFGRIVNFGEVGAERTAAHARVAAWAAAKAGVVAFSKALALEEARFGITVNVVCPGVIEEKTGARGRRAAQAGNGTQGDRVPVGRAAHCDDVARAVLFFASPAADFLTGQVLAVAGGAYL